MSLIYVCPLSKVEETVRASGARGLVSLVEQGVRTTRPPEIEPNRHLVISISDIVEQVEGHILPEANHIEDLLAFVSEWDRRAPLVIHCVAGVSRSTAAAFISACALEPKVPERFFAQSIRANSPTANPNSRLVALADARLRRKGRMIRAVRAIGSGRACDEATAFSFSLARAPTPPAWWARLARNFGGTRV